MDPQEPAFGTDSPFTPTASLQRSPPSPLHAPVSKEQKTMEDQYNKMSTRSQNCKICRQSLANYPIISCHFCNESYHVKCTCLTSEFTTYFVGDKRSPFICFSCMNNGTHYKHFIENRYAEMEKKLQENLQSSVMNAIQSATSSIFATFKQELETHKTYINNELQKIREETDEKLGEMEGKIERNPPSQASSEKLNSLQEEINYLHAKVREKNLIISGIPEQTELDLVSIIKRIGNLYHTRINDNDIVSVHRMKTSNKTQNENTATASQSKLPPNILVEFENEYLRQELFNNYLTAIREKKTHTCMAIGIRSSRNIYVNEHLSKNILELKTRARLIQKAGGFEAVIARPQHVSVKIGDKWTKIASQEQMDSLVSGIGKQ